MISNFNIENICSISSGNDGDRFVGIKMISGIPEISFPIGYSLGQTEKELRNDISLLLRILRLFHYKDSNNVKYGNLLKSNYNFPLSAYQRMVKRYLTYGSYAEAVNTFSKSSNGKADWNRTIKSCTPQYHSYGPIYLEYISKESKLSADGILPKIYKYCVYKSFGYIGWLYTDKQLENPKIPFQKKLFISILKEKLNQTNSDNMKLMLTDMLTIVKNESNDSISNTDFVYGTECFEYIWEKLVEKAYGIVNKQQYFPRSYWHLSNLQINHALEPDTIMIRNNSIFILDAKYYRYGSTGNPHHLPDTSSIHKQITYGEYIDTNDCYVFDHIFNAFIMPANLSNGKFACQKNITCIGHASSNWKKGTKEYEYVWGILADTKYLMKNYQNKYRVSEELSNTLYRYALKK